MNVSYVLNLGFITNTGKAYSILIILDSTNLIIINKNTQGVRQRKIKRIYQGADEYCHPNHVGLEFASF
jgi:hypothetical protein